MSGFFLLILTSLSIGLSLTLERAVELALKNNVKSVEARIELKKVEQKIKEVRSSLFPTLSLQVELTRWDEGYVSSFVPTNRLFMSLTLSQNVFDRAIFLSVRLAKESKELRQLILEDVRQELTKEVKKLFYLVLLKRETLKQRRAFLSYWSSYLELVKGKYKEGMVPKHELLRAKAQLEMAKANLKRAESELRKAELSLASLLGIEGSLEVEGKLIPLDFDGEASLSRNSTLAVLKKSVELQSLSRKLAESEYYPRLKLFGNYQGNNLKDFDRGRLRDDFRHGYSVRLQADWTLLDWGKRKAKVNQESLELSKLRESYKSKERELKNTLSSILDELEALRLELKARRLSVKAAEESLKLSTERYKEGVGTQLEVLEAVQNYERAKIELLNTVYLYDALLFELERLRGY